MNKLQREWERDIRIETTIIIVGVLIGAGLLLWFWTMLDP